MEDNQHDSSNRQDNSTEIDLLEIIGILWNKKKFILKVVIIFLIIGVVYAISSPVRYNAGCKLLPISAQKSSSELGGLAAAMGFNIGMSNAQTSILTPNVYPMILNSTPFLLDIMETDITLDSGEHVKVFNYYTDAKYQKFNLISTIAKYTIGLPQLIFGSSKKSKPLEQVNTTDSARSIVVLNGNENSVSKIIQSSMNVNLDKKEGILSIDYTFPDANGAAQIAENIRITLEKYVTTYNLSKVKDDYEFIKEQYEDAKDGFLKKQERLASFREANRVLSTPLSQTKESTLQSEYNIAFTVYNELAKQFEQAKIAVKENKPIISVIDPVIVPREKSAPRRGIIVFAFIFMGMVISMGWVLSKHAIDKMKHKAGG